MSATTFIFFGPACLAVLPLLVLPLGMLGFAIPANYARVEAKMTVPSGTSVLRTLIHRAMMAPLC